MKVLLGVSRSSIRSVAFSYMCKPRPGSTVEFTSVSYGDVQSIPSPFPMFTSGLYVDNTATDLTGSMSTVVEYSTTKKTSISVSKTTGKSFSESITAAPSYTGKAFPVSEWCSLYF